VLPYWALVSPTVGEIAILVATSLLAVAGVVHGGALARLQIGGFSPLVVLDKPRRSVPLEGRRQLPLSIQGCAK
jgi:hypothetical protein